MLNPRTNKINHPETIRASSIQFCQALVFHKKYNCTQITFSYSKVGRIKFKCIDDLQSFSVKCKHVLCVSYPSATEFSAILFLLFARLSSNSPRSFQRFRRTLRRNFNWIRQQMKNFPIDPPCKIARFRQRCNVAKSGRFLQWGSMEKLFTICRI